jgi:hypothetical protein
MAESKITGLTTLSALSSGDYLPIVDVLDTTQAATGTTKKVAISSIIDTDGTLAANSDTKIPSQKAVKTYADAITTAQNLKNSGWISVSDSWTYASASTITVPSGATSLYQKGDKIKWTQTTVKYGVIVTVADTLLTIAVNTDYVVTNAAISAISVSHAESPVGFPDYFNFTASFGNFGSGSSTYAGRFSLKGRTATIWVHAVIGAGGGVFGQISFASLPIPALDLKNYEWASAILMDANGSYWSAFVSGSNFWIRGTNGQFAATSATSPFTWAVGDSLDVTGTYEIA